MKVEVSCTVGPLLLPTVETVYYNWWNVILVLSHIGFIAYCLYSALSLCYC